MADSMNQDDDPIRRIVREELTAAERLSPEAERKERLSRILDRAESDASRRRLFLPKWAYVLAPTSVFVVLAVVIAIALFSNGRTLALTTYLEKQSVTFDVASSAALLEAPRDEDRLSGRMADPERSSYMEVFLATFPKGAEDAGKAPASLVPANPRMSFEETVRTLYFDRSLEKFLLQHAKRQKEV
jgi:hypothetical protein